MHATEKRFLWWSFLLGWAGFGGLLWLDRQPGQPWHDPAACILFCLACAGPLVGAVRAAGLPLRASRPRPWALAGLFLTLHFGLAVLMGFIAPPGPAPGRALLLPAAVLLGAQELGWRMVLQPALARTRTGWKAGLAAALLQALWLLPLLFLSWSPVGADLFLPAACGLVGMGALSATLRRLGGGWLCLGCFSSLFFLLTALMPGENELAWYGMAGVDLLLSFLYTSGLVRENQAVGTP